MASKRQKLNRACTTAFPEGDTLGVVFSFLTAYELLRGSLFIVCKEWHRVLCSLPHAWGDTLDLSWPIGQVPRTLFAWNCVKVCLLRTIFDHIKARHVQKLELGDMQRLFDISRFFLLSHLSIGIDSYQLKSNIVVADADLAYVRGLPLTRLELLTCIYVTDAGLAHLSSLPLLHLNLAYCEQVTDAGLTHLSSLPLQYLNLADCEQVTDAGLAHLSSLPLQHLDLAFCVEVTDDGLAHLSSLPLQHLGLEDCGLVTDAGLAHLTSLPLKHVGLFGCGGVTAWHAFPL